MQECVFNYQYIFSSLCSKYYCLAGIFVLFTAVAMFTLSSDPETLVEEVSRELMSTCAKSDHVLVSCLSINLALSQLSSSP